LTLIYWESFAGKTGLVLCQLRAYNQWCYS